MQPSILATLTLVSTPLAGWPLWGQIALGIVVGAIALWILVKLFKIAIWLFLIALLLGAVAFFLREMGHVFIPPR